MSNLIAVGKLHRVRGNRGELLGEVYSSQPGRAEKLKEVTLEKDGKTTPVQIEELWFHQGRPVFKFAGIDSISAAEPLAGSDVMVAESEKAEIEEGAFSYADLIGCQVLEGAKLVGTVVGVEEYGGPPTLKLEGVDGREILVPFARSICKEIDVAAKIIRVELPEGLLDL